MTRVLLPWLLLTAACGEKPPTWHEDVQPFVAENCGACHVPGGAAPFALETYAEVSAPATTLLAAMEDGSMPPWPADAECREYLGDRTLDPADIEMFRAWMDADMPQGEAVGEPAAPPEIRTIEPTHTARVPGYVSTATTADQYRCFVLDDLPIDETMYLSATQVIAGSPQVHHVLVYAVSADQRNKVLSADAAEEGAGYDCFGSPLPGEEFVSLDTVEQGFPNQLGAWVPGLDPAVQAPGDAIRIDAGSTVIMQVHYSALSGDPAPDETEFQAILTTDEPVNLVRTVPLLIPELNLPAGQETVRFVDEFRNYGRNPIQLTSFTAHMHLLGKRQKAIVKRADGAEECAMDVKQWDFDWQLSYILDPEEPLVLQPGDGIELTCVYDNSAENQPVIDGVPQEPRNVQWGDGTLDEMCLLYLTTVEPFTPVPDSSEPPCTDTEQCVADCGDTPTADCLIRCPEADADCSICMLTNSIGCGLGSCAVGFYTDQQCITSCLISTLMFGGSTGECLAQQCPEQYDPFAVCAEANVGSGECNDELNSCGWALP